MPTLFNRNIPAEAHTKMGSMAKNLIQVFAFTPSNGWMIVTKNRQIFARNIPEECFKKNGGVCQGQTSTLMDCLSTMRRESLAHQAL